MKQRGIGFFAFIFILLIFAGLIALGWYLVRLDNIIRDKFEGQRWDIPAKIYARPLELKNGIDLSIDNLVAELRLLNYKSGDLSASGTYQLKSNGEIMIHTRGFDFGDRNIPEQILSITFIDDKVDKIRTTKPNVQGKTYLEPLLIGGIYPQHNEDRVLIKLENTPQTLIDALIATEDRNFFSHHGLSIRGTARAIFSNLTGGKRQGGSTLTQQLIKNFYLNSEKTYKRKANEALMAMLLELHYSKNEILEAYLNEVNLGQSGNYSINGYGLASQFYFGRPLRELNLSQQAFLAGLVQGPSLYNPWKNPEGAIKRRNIVLKNMLLMEKITQEQYEKEIKRPLGVLSKPTLNVARFPHFMDMVRRQLRNEYFIQNLENQGLRVFTTLDPVAQIRVEHSFKATARNLNNTSEPLQGAALISNPHTGELIAIVGSTQDFTSGFNRALDAKRQVGSLLKPVIYLNALESGRYTWASLVEDTEIQVSLDGKEYWKPKNYGGGEHGLVPMNVALANSYNLAAVRLANEFSLHAFTSRVSALGASSTKLPNYPSVFLGAASLTPLDMLNMYQTFASGGVKRPVNAIRQVVDQKGQIIERYAITDVNAITPEHAYLLNHGLQSVVRYGTARAINTHFSPNLGMAGKTGTTNDGRDSWFAGYSGNYVTVVWLGYDDNRVTNLTGSTGALPVWINIMKQLQQKPVSFPDNPLITWQWIDRSGDLSAANCNGVMYIPMLQRTVPHRISPCAQQRSTLNDLPQDSRIDLNQEENGLIPNASTQEVPNHDAVSNPPPSVEQSVSLSEQDANFDPITTSH